VVDSRAGVNVGGDNVSKIKLIHDDFFNPGLRHKKFLFGLRGQVDLLLTDPPFNIADKGKVTKTHGKLYSNAQAWGTQFKDSFTPGEYDRFMKEFLRQAFVLLKPGGSLVTFIDDKYSGVLTRFAELINRDGHKKDPRQPMGFAHKKNIHFVKVNCVPKVRQYNYASAVEVAVWLVKPRLGKGASQAKPEIFNYHPPTKGLKVYDENGKPKLDVREYHNTYTSNVFFYTIGGGKKRSTHPCEKYTAMLTPMIETHSNPDSLVVDPFLGGGNTALTCWELGRNFVGIEIDEGWYQKASKLLATHMRAKK